VQARKGTRPAAVRRVDPLNRRPNTQAPRRRRRRRCPAARLARPKGHRLSPWEGRW
jgi:hypothetical protein